MASLGTLIVLCLGSIASVLTLTNAELTSDYYDKLCPLALPTIKTIVAKTLTLEPRMGASLLRLHFHDCFVNGCDGSILLDDTANITGEKEALPNLNSVRGFDVIDQIKAAVNTACKGNVVSCADILAVAARDSVSILGGPSYKVLLGRKDAKNASTNDANTNLPPPFFSLSQLNSTFQAHGLNLTDLVALSGGHTLGLARCTTFRDRIYNDSNIDATFASTVQKCCPRTGGDNNTQPLDRSAYSFDNQYFKDLVESKGLLHSDQELYKGDGSASDQLVEKYVEYPDKFAADFVASMIKMGNMKPLTEPIGEVRYDCRKVN